MGTLHREFLAAAQDEDNEEFIRLMRSHHRHGDDFDVTDIVKMCDSAQMDRMWEGILSKCSSAVLAYSQHVCDETLQSEDAISRHHVINEVVTVATIAIKQDLDKIPAALYDTAFLLNGVILHVQDQDQKLASHIADLLELWWKKNLTNYNLWAPNLLLYLLRSILLHKTTVSAMKRLWSMRECVGLLSWETEEGQTIWELVLQAVVTPAFIQRQEGRMFISFVLQEVPEFIKQVYNLVKERLISNSKSVQESYGALFLRIWQDSEGETRQVVEKSVIQDLMYVAVHVDRRGARSPHAAFRQVLNAFHTHRLLDGVDEALNRLYAPILWRSLSVTNTMVRANAASLLMDAFPLSDPKSGAEEKDKALQRQFDLILEIMEDASPDVRCIGIQGVCRICNMFWELIPQKTIAVFITKLVQEHAWDVSSDEVRLSVVRGLTLLLDNHLSHALLDKLLPLTRNMFHDKAEKVRLAYIALLMKVKVIKAIKYWSVVPMEHLLARLACDKPAVCRKLTEMLLSSFMPPDKDNVELVSRCQVLWQQNPKAARKFYQHAYKFHRPSFICNFLAVICRLLLNAVKSLNTSVIDSSMDTTTSETNTDDASIAAASNGEDDAMQDLASDTEAVAGFIETLLIMRTGIDQGLNQEKSSEWKNALNIRMSQVVAKFFRLYEDERITKALVLLSGFLPPKAVPMISGGALSRLRKFTPASDVGEWRPLIEVMCRWNRSHELLQLVNDWITPGLDPSSKHEQAENSNSTKRRVGFVESGPKPQPGLALSYLHQLLQNIICQEALRTSLEAHKALKEVTNTLNKITTVIEERLRCTNIVTDLLADDIVTQTYNSLLTAKLFLHNKEREDEDFGVFFKQHILWVQKYLVPALKRNKTTGDKPRKKPRRALVDANCTMLSDPSSVEENTTLMGSVMNSQIEVTQRSASVLLDSTLNLTKRNEEEMDSDTKLVITLIEHTLSVSWNMLMAGVGDIQLARQLANFCLELLNNDDQLTFLSSSVRVIKHIVMATLVVYTNVADVGLCEENVFISHIMAKCINLLNKLRKIRKSLLDRALSLIQTSFTETLSEYFLYYPAYGDNVDKMQPMTAITQAVLADLSDALRQESGSEETERFSAITKLPVLSACLTAFITKKHTTLSLFCEALIDSLEADGGNDVASSLSIIHLMFPITSKISETAGRKKIITPPAMIELLESLEARLETLSAAEPPESSTRVKLDAAKQCLKDCQAKIKVEV